MIHGDLDAARIAAALAARGVASTDVHLLATTGSTNDEARRAASAGAPHGALFIADAQTAGRGRGAHRWFSPAGANIYASLLLRREIEAPALPRITLVVGLAVAELVEATLHRGVLVKWPNDVLVDGRKLAGVLVEAQLRGSTLSALIVGVGLNVHTVAFPDELESTATSLLRAGGVNLDRSILVADLATRIHAMVARFAESGLEPFLPELRARDAMRGRRVSHEGALGVGEGLDAEGRLLVRFDDGALRAVASGEVLLATPSQSGPSCAT